MARTPVAISTLVTVVMERPALSPCHRSISTGLSRTYLTSLRGCSRSSPQTFALRISGLPRTCWGFFLFSQWLYFATANVPSCCHIILESQIQGPLRVPTVESPQRSFWFNEPLSCPGVRGHDEDGACCEPPGGCHLGPSSPFRRPVAFPGLLPLWRASGDVWGSGRGAGC